MFQLIEKIPLYSSLFEYTNINYLNMSQLPRIYELPMVKVRKHRKTLKGVYLQVLFSNGSKEWMTLYLAMDLDANLTNEYLEKFPELLPYHETHYG